MHSFSSIILKFESKGEKTGWSYVDVPQDIISKLKLKNKKEFRIKGFADNVKFERMTCFPIGGGNFIIVLNGEIRKKLGKKEGAMVSIKFETDDSGALKSEELMECLKDDQVALEQFDSMTMSNQNYFHNHILAGKGADTRAGRIINTISAMHKKQNFGEMIRSLQKKNN